MKLLAVITAILVLLLAIVGAGAYMLYDNTAMPDGYSVGSVKEEISALASDCEKKLDLSGETYIIIGKDNLNRLLGAIAKEKLSDIRPGVTVKGAYLEYTAERYHIYAPAEIKGFPVLIGITAAPDCSGSVIRLTLDRIYLSKLRLPDKLVGKIFDEIAKEIASEIPLLTADSTDRSVSFDLGETAREIIFSYIDMSNPLIRLIANSISDKFDLSCSITDNGSIKISLSAN